MLKARAYLKDGSFELDPNMERLREILKDPENQVWIDIEHIAPPELLFLQEELKIHPIAVEELLFPTDRPEVQLFEDHIFLVLHAPAPGLAKGGMDTVEIDFLVGRNFIVTVRSGPIASVRNLESQIKANPKIMSRGCDFMLYFIADAMVDDYLPILDSIDQRLDAIQETTMKHPTRETFGDLMKLKADILEIRRATVPQLTVLRSLVRGHADIIEAGLSVYFRSVCEHLEQINAHLDSFREEANSTIQVSLAVVSNRVNDVVKVFTVVAVLLMPPTVIASIFGMNFYFPPWLVTHGLWLTCLLMTVMTVWMLLYLKKKRWL